MTPEIQQLREIIEILMQRIDKIERKGHFAFNQPLRGETNGLRLGIVANDRIGFFDASPIAQWNSGTGRQDLHDNTGVAMNVGARFTGNTGSAYYGVGDIVAALKAYGLLDT
jgi:hypothetical protein